MHIDVATRPGWDEYFMGIAHLLASRANCIRRKVAAVVVRNQRIISTGYNGTPRGVKNCFDGGCPRCLSGASSGENAGDCICNHAEENAIVQAAYHGVSVRKGTLYCTLGPCLACTRMIINADIREVVYESRYCFSKQSLGLFETTGITCRQFKQETE